MVTQTATALDLSTEDSRADSRNYWGVLEGWWETDRRDELTPIAQLTFGALIHMANRRWFPTVMDVDKKELERLVRHSRESVRRALAQLSAAGLIHLAATQGRGRVQVRICYEAFEAPAPKRRAVRAQSEREKPVRAQIVQNEVTIESPEPQLPSGIPVDSPSDSSTTTGQGVSEETRNCSDGTTGFAQVGEDLKPGSTCPRCRRHPLTIRFKTNLLTSSRDAFLACRGYADGGCEGFTWQVSSTPFQRAKKKASTPRPSLVIHTRPCPEPDPVDPVVNLSDLWTRGRFLPVDLLLDALDAVAPDLARRHREEGSDKHAILRDVKAACGASPTASPSANA